MELIEREALMNLLNFYTDETVSAIIADVEAIPVIEAGPVVRCKDCRFGLDLNGKIACTECRERIHGVNDYCSYGERKDALNAEKGGAK